jgi:hypothetical protein
MKAERLRTDNKTGIGLKRFRKINSGKANHTQFYKPKRIKDPFTNVISSALYI